MKVTAEKRWKQSVSRTADKLEPVKSWLRQWIYDTDTDWYTQKAAHQALKFLELAEYEMWNMQYWDNSNNDAFIIRRKIPSPRNCMEETWSHVVAWLNPRSSSRTYQAGRLGDRRAIGASPEGSLEQVDSTDPVPQLVLRA